MTRRAGMRSTMFDRPYERVSHIPDGSVWRRISGNVGYLKLATVMSSASFFDWLAKQAIQDNATHRIWHTKHLMVVWETEHGDV